MNESAIARAYDYQTDREYEAQQLQSILAEQREQEQIERFTAEIQVLNSDEYQTFTEDLCCDDLFWLAVGSGDYSKVEQIKQQAIRERINQGFYKEG